MYFFIKKIMNAIIEIQKYNNKSSYYDYPYYTEKIEVFINPIKISEVIRHETGLIEIKTSQNIYDSDYEIIKLLDFDDSSFIEWFKYLTKNNVDMVEITGKFSEGFVDSFVFSK